MSADDKYTYRGSGGVLVNTRGIEDLRRLDHALDSYASAAWALLRLEPVPDRLDFDYLKYIHRRMFSRLLTWAGEVRDVDTQAEGTGIAHCRPEYIEPAATDLFRKLASEDYLRALDAREFADRLADRWGELSAIHPCRDGTHARRAPTCRCSRRELGILFDGQRSMSMSFVARGLLLSPGVKKRWPICCTDTSSNVRSSRDPHVVRARHSSSSSA